MDLHIVGGFLGSGKTTTIIGAARHLTAQGKRVGVITNDQGKYLVDTAFVRLADIPAVEVSGGCFCCNYNDFTAQIATLQQQAQPDVIFAESVGSCADLVATVLRPLRDFDSTMSSFSVFADSRLLLHWLRGDMLPFSENIVYLFGQQIEEAGLLVINKADLLTPNQQREIERLARERFPGKPIRLQNSLRAEGIAGWLDQIAAKSFPAAPLHLDYQKYGEAEQNLAWVDMQFTLDDSCRETLVALLRRVRESLGDIPVGHLKIVLWNDAQSAKISFPTLDEPGWETSVPHFLAGQIRVMLNLRAESGADTLRNRVEKALKGLPTDNIEVDAFHPRWPTPTYRLLD